MSRFSIGGRRNHGVPSPLAPARRANPPFRLEPRLGKQLQVVCPRLRSEARLKCQQLFDSARCQGTDVSLGRYPAEREPLSVPPDGIPWTETNGFDDSPAHAASNFQSSVLLLTELWLTEKGLTAQPLDVYRRSVMKGWTVLADECAVRGALRAVKRDDVPEANRLNFEREIDQLFKHPGQETHHTSYPWLF